MKFFTKIFSFAILSLPLAFFYSEAQVSFTNSNSQLQGAPTHSGCTVAVVDVNGDGLDDIVRLEQGHDVYIDYQRPGELFTHNHIADFGGGSGWSWGMCVADADHNGFKDVVAGGYGPSVELLLVDNTGIGGTIVSLPNSNFFVQNMNFMDVNNDGWEDIFSCDDNAESHIWVNDGTGNFVESSIIDFNVTNTDDSGNYGSVWTDFDNDNDVDFYIAKCRQAIGDPSDGRRIDVLFVNNGNGTYTSNAAAYGLADSGQTWTCNFTDIDNDGDLDVIQTDYDVPAKLLENDGAGHMVNITSGSGFDISDIYPTESAMEDFDNDGFVDILVTGDHADFFHNNGDHTFTKLNGLFDNNGMKSFALGDLNHDGMIDLYSSYATGYTTPSNVDDVYWLNNTLNGNHYITFNLIGSTSTPASLGARVTLYGSWGIQVREVHAGESYGTCNSSNLHFGLGAATSIDSAVVRWPSGTVTAIINPSVNQFVTVQEGGCISPDFTLGTGPFVLCPGATLTLTASSLPSGYTYLWSDNSTAQSLDVFDGGTYYVTAVSSTDVCSVTTAAYVQVSPEQIPVITATGDLTFCEGGSVTLTCTSASAYYWSSGETTQSITVTQSGSYSVTIQGDCSEWSSNTIDVNVLGSTPPVTTGATLTQPGAATVTATGNNISWYEVPAGGSPIATGPQYTSYVTATDTFYAEGEALFADTLHTGMTYHMGTSLYSGSGFTNAITYFEVINYCTLKSAKVYTDIPGNRLVELRDPAGNVLQSIMVNVPMDTNRITLDFDLTPGSYQIGTNSDQNEILLGTGNYGPHLQRSNQGVAYPYIINDLVTINGCDQGPFYYYYFYDWEVLPPSTVCITARAPAIVTLTTGIENTISSSQFELFPNPSTGLVTITSDITMSGKVKMEVADVAGQLLLSRTEDGMKSGEQIQLDLSQFAKGIYFLNIQSGENTMQHKIVIQ